MTPRKQHMEIKGRELEYLERRGQRIRKMSISVDASCNVIVRAPAWAAHGDVEKFIAENYSWIENSLAEMSASRRQPIDGTDGSVAILHGKEMTVMTHPTNDASLEGRYELDRNAGVLRIFTSDNCSDAIPVLARFYFDMTAKYLGTRIPEIESITGLCAERYEIGTYRSKWGSCSSAGIIRFNSKLSLFPYELMDYVIVHEMCHLKNRRHDTRFWESVSSFIDDVGVKRKRMRSIALGVRFAW
ncbi:MAG: M48 family metallopeptidase [Thermoplasmata archaeon YP2-bin.285]|uniref:M48 family metallopeptidase n=1 Tax=Candidatus Sysuiplasma superficiale TaxID=2823368 RepID=A0A8J7YJV9_9ARCH|nr:M48 family metallopeptidase [Candidatus Sysuiplasma superficiale]